ncbi:sulfite exporter TauE/SafE family protein [Janthinobacterium agaricidamnosum]|uniref:Probable membrane transporter protein n=1 Tax=Janthinobacterium agaricidamnosum NBRC 102515 = DSM 9628 TaxID=1349767 RepID=W0V0M3_9BURK|nr:sulfite exporter TauE/SafE family protein [Janthinobacterium agaricidamnosum]CDG80837.1 conserved hypothetical protein [Janthinobacterium agaricidamnosum NBRC 102515 = DSM 9628]
MTEHLLLQTVLNLGLGVLLGAIGGLLGIGGGLIAIPVLGFLYGMEQHLAQGTALVMIAPNVLIGFVRYRQRNVIDLRATAGMCVLAVLSAGLAAHFASRVSSGQLRFGFACFLIVLALYFIRQIRSRPLAKAATPLPERYLPLVGLLSGAMSGLFSIGGGMVAVPVLASLFGWQQTRAQGVALGLVIPGSVVALFSYAQAGYVNWQVGIALALGGLLSVSWGVALAHRLPAAWLRLAFCSVLIVTATLLLVH